MPTFSKLAKDIVKLPQYSGIIVSGQKKLVRGIVRLTSWNSIDEDYIKVAFTDHTGLLFLLSPKEVYLSKLLGEVEGVADEKVGQPTVTFGGRKFRLENKDDYQFVKQLYCGSPLDAETECRFSDYSPEDEAPEILSLGWMVNNGERADVFCEEVSPNAVVIAP
jgi:hypothetical protein